MRILSTQLENGTVPREYTCDGRNEIPPLQFDSAPQQTISLVLIVDDPDAPAGTWDHWLLYNIPPKTKGIDEGVEPQWPHGVNSAKQTNWHGPCPPDREHRYFFTLYALDKKLEFAQTPTKKELLKAMEGHVLEKAVLVAAYKRPWMK